MATYNSETIKTTKQFTRACNNVSKGFGTKSEEYQQLLVLAVNEAAREAGGQVTNNLTWLTQALLTAKQTNGINFTKVVRYVKEVLCCNTIAWSAAKKQVVKSSVKGTVLTYNTQPETTWYNYGKEPSIAAAFDYGKRVTSAINSAMKADKGGMSAAEVVAAILASDSINLDDLLNAVAVDEAA